MESEGKNKNYDSIGKEDDERGQKKRGRRTKERRKK